MSFYSFDDVEDLFYLYILQWLKISKLYKVSERERKLYYKEYFIPISGDNDNDKYTRYTELSSYLTK
jgi:hypothetical protein